MKGNMMTQELQKFMRGIGEAYKEGSSEMERTEVRRVSRRTGDGDNELTVFQNPEFGKVSSVQDFL